MAKESVQDLLKATAVFEEAKALGDQQAAIDQKSSGFDIKKALAKFDAYAPRDPNTGNKLPSYGDGGTADTPINQSPLSIGERAKLSFSDEKGKEKFLRERFGAIHKNKHGDLTVANNGKWHIVDPNGFGEKDPWEVTKKLMSGEAPLKQTMGDMAASLSEGAGDVADASKEISLLVASLGVGVATAGASLGVQTASSVLTGGLTSLLGNATMGKLSGTYTGDIDDMLAEAGMEMLINAGGMAIVPGAKLIGKGVKGFSSVSADALKKAAQTNSAGKWGLEVLEGLADKFKGVPEQSKEVLAQLIGAPSKVGDKNVRLLLDKTSQVKDTLKRAVAGRKDEAALEFLKSDSRQQAVKFLDGIREGLDGPKGMYETMMKEVEAALPKGFSASRSQVSSGIVQNLTDMGLIQADGAMVGKDALRLLDGSKSKLVEELQSSKEARSIFKDLIEGISAVSRNKGSVGFRELVGVDKALRGRFDRAIQLAKNPDVRLGSFANELQTMKKAFGAKFDEGLSLALANVDASQSPRTVGNILKSVGGPKAVPKVRPEDLYRTLKKDYHKAASEFETILDLSRDAANPLKDTSNVYHRLAKQLAGRTEDPVMREQAGAAIKTIGKYSTKIQEAMEQINYNDAAGAFVPKIRSNFVQFAPLFGFMSGATQAVATGDISGGTATAALGGAALVAATSPRNAMHTILASRAAKRSLYNGISTARNLMFMSQGKLSEAMRKQPEVSNALGVGIIRGAKAAMQMEEQLNMQIQQGMSGGAQ